MDATIIKKNKIRRIKPTTIIRKKNEIRRIKPATIIRIIKKMDAIVSN